MHAALLFKGGISFFLTIDIPVKVPGISLKITDQAMLLPNISFHFTP